MIGSGPAGLSAALYLKRAGKKVLIVEKEYEGTGQIAQSFCVENYLGFPSIAEDELGEKFRLHVQSLDIPFLEEEVIEILHHGGWELRLASGKSLETKTIVYAAGAVPVKPGIQGEEEYTGKGISFCAYCDGSLYKNKDVAVVGGGDTALDDALYLSGICRKVYLIHRRSEFRGMAAAVEKLREKENVEIITEARILEAKGQKRMEEIRLDQGRNLKISGLFVAIGSRPETELIKAYVTRDTKGYVAAKEDGKTETPGLFVAGDIRVKKLRQVITAVSDGANAAASAVDFLNRQGYLMI